MEQERKISTFTAEEKEAMEKFNTFEAEINRDIGENEKITKINFYNGASVRDGIGRQLDINMDLYIVEKQGEDGKKQTYIFAGSPDNIIGFVDENGNIEFADEKLRSLGIQMTLEEFKEANFEKLMIKSEELTPEELKKYLEREKENKKGEDSEELEDEHSEDEAKQAEEELSEKSGNDYKFYFYKKITKPGLANEISGSQGKELAFAIDSNKGAMIIDTKTGERLPGTGER